MISIGSKVGARRWPYAHAHPDCWGKPWAGTVLSVLDPRAWAGSLAFPSPRPSRAAVAAHCARHGITDGGEKVPVLWDFGSDGTAVYWQRVGPDEYGLKSYAEDLAAWVKARWAERAARKAA